jgi:8-oxo-dGTP pyrophosphatase MutT (NUDIX family)
MPMVVTVILINKNCEILILKRSDKVRTYKGLWCGVSGYVEKDEEPIKTALKEIREEVGLEKDDINLIKQCKPIEFTDFYDGERYDWVIFPFLFKIEKKVNIQIDWEHIEYRWVSPSELEKYDTVPQFKEVVSKLLI